LSFILLLFFVFLSVLRGEKNSIPQTWFGLAARCSRPFDQGQKVQVKIFIPGLNKYHPGFFKVFESDVGQDLTAVAEIVGVRPDISKNDYMVGLEFLDIYEDDLSALQNLIRSALG